MSGSPQTLSAPHSTGTRPASRVPIWLALLALLIALLLAPSVAERVSYSITRGHERAEVDGARAALPNPGLAEISKSFAVVAKAIGPSVVHIDTVQVIEGSGNDFFEGLFPRSYRALEGQGTGVIVDARGYVLTNYHVVKQARAIEVKLSDGETREGRVVGADPATDLALVKVDSDHLVAAQWGDSEALPVGALVWAVGNPFGLDRSVTFGIVSAKSRHGLGANLYEDFLQTDAAVNPGNSGGPLVDVGGKVVGINTAMVGHSQGISFAIPSSIAREVYERLKETGHVERAYLGASLAEVTPEIARQLDLPTRQGVLVKAVLDDTPAAKAGLEAGDVIISWNGKPVEEPAELHWAVSKSSIGSKVPVVIYRDGRKLTISVMAEALPTRLSR